MSGIIERFFKNYCPVCKADEKAGGDLNYTIFRVGVGLMFFQHGLQKVFGLFGGVGGTGMGVPDLTSLFGYAGLIELIGGLAVILGVFTRLSALIVVIEMAVAYFMVHAPKGAIPLLNGGELAVLFFLTHLLMLKYGSGKWGLERAMLGKEVF